MALALGWAMRVCGNGADGRGATVEPGLDLLVRRLSKSDPRRRERMPLGVLGAVRMPPAHEVSCQKDGRHGVGRGSVASRIMGPPQQGQRWKAWLVA